MTILLASKALDCVEFSILLWDALHLFLGSGTKSSLVNYLIWAYGGDVTLLMTIKALDKFLRMSCIVPCLAILPFLGSEANTTLILQASLLAQYIIESGLPFVASIQVIFQICDLGLELFVFLYKVSITRHRGNRSV